jgi:hypothetical protein
MKNNLILLISLIFFSQAYAQVPQGFSYQAIYRDAQGNAIGNQNVNVVLSILDSFSNGIAVYSETHNTLTNEFGLVVLSVGTGTPIIGNFANVNWSNNDKFLKVEFDGNLTSTTQLLSVPYAMFAGNGSSWKDTSFVVDGNTFPLVLSRKAAIVSTTPFINGTDIGNGGMELWAPYPAIDFKNEFIRDADMRIAFDSTGVDRISISTYKANNQWDLDQFVFTKEGAMGVGASNPKEDLEVIGNIRASTVGSNSDYVLIGGNDGAIILQRDNDGAYIDFTKDKADPTGLAFRMQSINGGLRFITVTNGNNLAERVSILNGGNFGIGTINPKSKFQVTDGDVYIESVNKGVIMKSPNGQCWRMTVSNTGQPIFNSITCP